MPRIFVAFVTGLLLVLVAVAGLGLFVGDQDPTRHIALAVFALLLSCLLQATVFIYLTVTGKIIVQAVHLGDSDHTPIHEVKRIKMQFTVILATVVAVIVFVTATGAYQWREGVRSYVHFAAAALFLLVHLVAAYHQFGLICRNKALMGRVLTAYTPHSARASTSNA